MTLNLNGTTHSPNAWVQTPSQSPAGCVAEGKVPFLSQFPHLQNDDDNRNRLTRFLRGVNGSIHVKLLDKFLAQSVSSKQNTKTCLHAFPHMF